MKDIKIIESLLLDSTNNINSLNDELLGYIDELIKKLSLVDEAYTTNSSVSDKIDSIINSLIDIKDSYKSRTNSFLKVLNDSILAYKDSDKTASSYSNDANFLSVKSISSKNNISDQFFSASSIFGKKIDSKVIPYTIDKNGNVSLDIVHPELQYKMEELVNTCKEEGIDIKITESVRSAQRQDELYAQGRVTNGKIVTNAKGSDYSSNHQWGIAFDVCINSNDINEMYDTAKLKRVGEIGKSIGLEWGGDWKGLVDMPHFQLPDYGSSTKKLKSMYKNPAEFYDDAWPKSF